MSAALKTRTNTRLTPQGRVARGFKYSALGPLDIVGGTLGLGVHGTHSAASRLRQWSEKGKLARELSAAQETIADELGVAQQVVAGLPQAYAKARKPQRRKLPWVVAAGVLMLVGGAVAFSIIRRSMQPEPSPRPPSVDVEPKP